VAGFVGFYTLFYLFPDGRFVPRWTLITTVAILLLVIANNFFPGSPFDPSSWPPVVNVVVSLGIAASLIFAQVYRYAYVSSPLQRQQTKWVTLSMVITIVSLAATSVLEGVPQLHVTSGADALFGIVSFVTYGLVFISVPFAICIALLRYHLWDVDIIINRTLVYATFTMILTTIWVTLTTLINQTAQYLFGGSSAVIATVLPTVTILTIFQPLRTTLEQWVNRRFYPSNLEMTRDFVEFSLASLEVSEVTDLIVRRVCQLLQCEYGAIFLGSGDADFKVISTWKIDADGLAAMSLPLTIHDRWGRAKVVQQPADTLFVILAPLYIPRLRKEEVRGILALGPRAADGGYSWDDRRGLIRFGEEAGKKIYASQLAAAKVKT